MRDPMSSGNWITFERLGDGSNEELAQGRKAAFLELRDRSICEVIVSAVEHFHADAPVYWVSKGGNPPADGEPVEPWMTPPWNADPPYDAFRPAGYATSAGETLAQLLLSELDKLKDSDPAPVRGGGKLSRLVISIIALDLLEQCRETPGRKLVNLLRALLHVDRPRQTRSKQFAARHAAVSIRAQDETLSKTELAQVLDVDVSTVSRWLRDPAFVSEVEKKRRELDQWSWDVMPAAPPAVVFLTPEESRRMNELLRGGNREELAKFIKEKKAKLLKDSDPSAASPFWYSRNPSSVPATD